MCYTYIISSYLDYQRDEVNPIGIVAIAAHYDSTLLSIVTKAAAALAAGNVCLILPHRSTPLSAFLFAEICEQSGVPPGVVNVLGDNGEDVLLWAASDPRIGALTFDGHLAVCSNVFGYTFNRVVKYL